MKKDYILSVPVMNLNFAEHMNRESTVKAMQNMGVNRIFLAVESNSIIGEAKEKELAAMKENVIYLHSRGFEVGAWFWTFYYTEKCDYTRLTSPDGKVGKEIVCPTDENYCRVMFDFIKACALTGVDLIMFDDDFRYGFQDIGFGCLCDNHFQLIKSYLGKDVTRQQLAFNIMNGGKNKYRDAFIKANGAVFEAFAAGCRKALDSVRTDVRMGFCSCITSWDIDGTTPDRISRLLAGKTKPFYRLIGAPYWAALNCWGHRLSYVIEQERLEMSRREDSDIEVFSEGDTFPRPRYRVPAAYLEGFDTALRADGSFDGILKYMFDYTSSDEYEKGYTEAHMRNMKLYEIIDGIFSDKETVGVRVFDNMRKFNTIEMPTDEKDPYSVQNTAFSASARFLACSSVPTVYSGNDYGGIAFGEDARIVTEDDMKNGLIIDFDAAKILMQKGIDIGYLTDDGLVEAKSIEYFSSGEKTGNFCTARLHRVELCENAAIDSWCYAGEEKLPLCYRYENGKGQRFVVYTFAGYFCDDGLFRSYCRQKQVIDGLKWLSGKVLPAHCPGHPDLYMLTKIKGNRLSVGIWNFHADKIYGADIFTAQEIQKADLFGATGTADKNILHINELDAFGCAFAELELI